MQRFETDLTDKQWAIIEPFIPQTRTKPRSIDMREVVNAILYVFKTGIKRHIIVDTQGNLLILIITAANIPDRNVLDLIINELRNKNISGKVVFIIADGGYRGKVVKQLVHGKGLKLKVIKKAKNGFKVLPRRWVVERSFAWLGGFGRLSKHYEFHLQTATAFVYLAFISLLLNRLFTIY